MRQSQQQRRRRRLFQRAGPAYHRSSRWNEAGCALSRRAPARRVWPITSCRCCAVSSSLLGEADVERQVQPSASVEDDSERSLCRLNPTIHDVGPDTNRSGVPDLRASPSDGHVPTAPLAAGAVRPPHPLSRLDGHSDSLYFQLAAEEAAERLAQSRQARSHRLQIQERVSETVGVP
jgi:hypothetical protein